MWRYREWLPLADAEAPITLGEGGTPLLTVPRVASKHGLRGLFLKEEGANPTGSFKARGLAAAVTDRKSTRLNSSHEWISYAVFCLKKKKKIKTRRKIYVIE